MPEIFHFSDECGVSLNFGGSKRIMKDIKETKRYVHTHAHTVGRTDNVNTVYPPTNTLCGGYNYRGVRFIMHCLICKSIIIFFSDNGTVMVGHGVFYSKILVKIM